MKVGLHNLFWVLTCVPLIGAAPITPPPFEIVSFKIVSYYNPLLDRGAPMDASARETERTPAENVARNTRTTNRSPQERANEIGVPPGAAPQLKHISPAEWVYFTVKNTSEKTIQALVWEFAFLRMEQGQLVLAQTMESKVELKPGKQKTIRQPLPPGASRCKVISAQKESTQEYVCGRGFADPSLLKEKPAPVGVRRIEYADGSSWQRR
jgi:hypothetical protein